MRREAGWRYQKKEKGRQREEIQRVQAWVDSVNFV